VTKKGVAMTMRSALAKTGPVAVALLALAAVSTTAMAADRTVLGEYFNATW
jgi:hypothetical protein